MVITTYSMDAVLKDHFPSPGTRIKQYVVDERRERAWVLETCPKIVVSGHADSCDVGCRNVGSTAWCDLDHDSCYVCGDLMRETAYRPDVMAWCDLRDARPPVTTDNTLLSDEVQPVVR